MEEQHREVLKNQDRIWFKRSPFVDYKIGDEKFTMHYNNTQLITVPDGRAELFCVCFWDSQESPEADPVLFFDPPYMDFLRDKGFPAQEVSDPELIDFIEEKYNEVQIARFNDAVEAWDGIAA